jgi:transposase-like protein
MANMNLDALETQLITLFRAAQTAPDHRAVVNVVINSALWKIIIIRSDDGQTWTLRAVRKT